jgi:hypothetical protein
MPHKRVCKKCGERVVGNENGNSPYYCLKCNEPRFGFDSELRPVDRNEPILWEISEDNEPIDF